MIQQLFLPGVDLVRMNLMALRQIAYRRLLPHRRPRDLRLQNRINLPSRLRHLPLRPVPFGADFFQLCHWSENPGHFTLGHKACRENISVLYTAPNLHQHQCVLLQARNNEAEWHLVSDKKSIKLHVSGPVAARDLHTVSAFTYRGHGVGLLPSTYCDAQIGSRELVWLLPGWSSPEIDVHAVYLTRRFLPAKLQVFLEDLKAWKSPQWIPLR
jgi:DNA-binding transcriptional LysR family regulator